VFGSGIFMNGKRTPLEVFLTTAVGLGMLTNTTDMVRSFSDVAKKMVPMAREYTGMVGSNVVEYGLPVLSIAAGLFLTNLAVRAVDHYQKNMVDNS